MIIRSLIPVIENIAPFILVSIRIVMQASEMIDPVKICNRYGYEYSCAKNFYYIIISKLYIVNNVWRVNLQHGKWDIFVEGSVPLYLSRSKQGTRRMKGIIGRENSIQSLTYTAAWLVEDTTTIS